MKIHGIDQKKFAICLASLAILAATGNNSILLVACFAAIVITIARLVDARQKILERKNKI
ncbi:hypothetical protein [Xanthomonas cassavae]|nr:hypothetical protein [Xanthomonas cassavae]